MDLNTFLDHFDTIAQAPNGIPKLRSLILDLAVQGKLVSQDPEDEPAEKPLMAIELERKQLLEKGQIRKTKSSKTKVFEESEFLVPNGWQVVPAEDAFLIITDGDHQPPPKSDNGISFLVIGNISKGYLDFSQIRFVTHEYFDNLDWGRKPEKGDILYTVTGSYGIPLVINTGQKFCVQRHIAILKTSDNFSREFLKIALSSSTAKRHADNVATGIAQKTVPLSGLRSLPIPIPPLAEQKRIVEKVDELMALCDRLQASQETQAKLRQKLRESAIDSLMNAETDEELQKSWAIVCDNWQTLSQKPEDVDDLRQVVIQLAVEGKLVAQNSADEPASFIVKRALDSREELVAARKISRRETQP